MGVLDVDARFGGQTTRNSVVGRGLHTGIKRSHAEHAHAMLLPPTLSFGQVWQTLAAVLHMSNLGFDRVDNEQGEIASISDRAVSADDAKAGSTSAGSAPSLMPFEAHPLVWGDKRLVMSVV